MLAKASIFQATTKPSGTSNDPYYIMDVISHPKVTLFKCKDGLKVDWFAFLNDPYKLKK